MANIQRVHGEIDLAQREAKDKDIYYLTREEILVLEEKGDNAIRRAEFAGQVGNWLEISKEEMRKLFKFQPEQLSTIVEQYALDPERVVREVWLSEKDDRCTGLKLFKYPRSRRVLGVMQEYGFLPRHL